MKETNAGPVSFRPTEVNRQRLEYAKAIGIETTRLVNDLLEAHAKKYIERERTVKKADWAEVLSAPIP